MKQRQHLRLTLPINLEHFACGRHNAVNGYRARETEKGMEMEREEAMDGIVEKIIQKNRTAI